MNYMEKAISESLLTASYNIKCRSMNEVSKFWKKYCLKQYPVLVLAQHITVLLWNLMLQKFVKFINLMSVSLRCENSLNHLLLQAWSQRWRRWRKGGIFGKYDWIFFSFWLWSAVSISIFILFSQLKILLTHFGIFLLFFLQWASLSTCWRRTQLVLLHSSFSILKSLLHLSRK